MTKWLLQNNITRFNTSQQLPTSKKHATFGQISAKVRHLLRKRSQTFGLMV